MRGLILHTVLMVAALAALGLLPPEHPPEAPTEVKLAALELNQIHSLKYTWPDGSATYQRITDDFFIAKLPEASFPAGFAPHRAIGKLAPLIAKRDLGVVPSKHLGAMGLENPERRLEIQSSQGLYVIEIGEATYGAQARYVRFQKNKNTLLMEANRFRGLEGSTHKLMKTRLTPPGETVKSFRLTLEDKEKEWLHHWDKDPKAEQYTFNALSSPEAKTLVSHLGKVRMAEYLTELPPELVPVLKAQFSNNDSHKEHIQILRALSTGEFYARYSHSAFPQTAWVGRLRPAAGLDSLESAAQEALQ